MKKWIAIALLSVSMIGCKQGIGERCQVTADCAEGICAVREPYNICVTTDEGSGGMFDAEPPPPGEAAVDAP